MKNFLADVMASECIFNLLFENESSKKLSLLYSHIMSILLAKESLICIVSFASAGN